MKYNAKIPGLKSMNEGVILDKGKIPVVILKAIINFFKKVHEVHNTECIVLLFMNEKDEYFLFVPKQKTSAASVDFDRPTDLENKYTLVAEIHSHNTIGAMWSSTDDGDEKAMRFYGVIGNIDEALTDIKFGHFKEILKEGLNFPDVSSALNFITNMYDQ